MLNKVTYIFQSATVPTNLEDANIHTAGWSESIWAETINPINTTAIRNLAYLRALLLPVSAAIIGYRISLFTIAGNKLLPSGSSTINFRAPGNPAFVTDVPQMALSATIPSDTSANVSRISMRCFPDSQIVGGEFQPAPATKTKLTNYFNAIADNDWGFIGRVLTNPSVRVLSLVAGVLTLSEPLVAAGTALYVRFLKVKQVNGLPLTGAYRIISGGSGVTPVIAIDSTITVGESGLARHDQVAYFNAGRGTFKRAVVRKVGRPFENYRGRASRSR